MGPGKGNGFGHKRQGEDKLLKKKGRFVQRVAKESGGKKMVAGKE